MPHVIFVCSANVFRSLSAQLALKSVLPPGSNITVASAGCWAQPDKRLRSDIKERLDHWGADYSGHKPRLLTQEIMDGADLVVAINHDHQAYIEQTFGRRVPVYMEIATGRPDIFRDLPDAVPDYRINKAEAGVYVRESIDMIFSYREAFLKNLPAYLPQNKSAVARPATPRPPAPF